MNGMPTTDKDPIIMNHGEIAVAKRRVLLENIKNETGVDPFEGRFLCDLRTIAYFCKKIVETGSRINMNPCLREGVAGSRVLYENIPFSEDLSIIEPVREKLKQRVERYRIGISLWKNSYSFESFEEMIREIFEVLFSEPSKMIESEDNND